MYIPTILPFLAALASALIHDPNAVPAPLGSCTQPSDACCLRPLLDADGLPTNYTFHAAKLADADAYDPKPKTQNQLEVRLRLERKYWYRDWRPWKDQKWHMSTSGSEKWKKYTRKALLSVNSPRFKWTHTITQRPLMEIMFNGHLLERSYPQCDLADDFACGPPGGFVEGSSEMSIREPKGDVRANQTDYDIELHAGNFCHLGKDCRAAFWRVGFLWDNAWLRYRGQFRNVPIDCEEHPKTERFCELEDASLPCEMGDGKSEFPWMTCRFDL